MLYAILRPESEIPLAYLDSVLPPTLEAMADHLAEIGGFPDRDALLEKHPDLALGYAQVH